MQHMRMKELSAYPHTSVCSATEWPTLVVTHHNSRTICLFSFSAFVPKQVFLEADWRKVGSL